MTKWNAASLKPAAIAWLTFGLVLFAAMFRIEAAPRESSALAQAEANRVSVDADDIGGVVNSSKGPEAGVWVIAETTDLPTKFRKIVVTDDAGRYLLPELPKATYKVWVRGYGLVDSKAVTATPGKTVALTAVIAPDSQAAAQYYPADYWFSLIKIPPKSEFPWKNPACGGQPQSMPEGLPTCEVPSQAQFLFYLKRRCTFCHQIGNKATREIEPSLGTFDSPSLAWDRRLMAGQEGAMMTRLLNRNFGHDRGLAMFADWSSRIAAGEVPPAPPRPQGIERNVVITLWEIDTDRSFIHDVIGTNDWHTTVNGYGPVYTLDWESSEIWALNPKENTVAKVATGPFRDENERKLWQPHDPQHLSVPSPYWGNEIAWTEQYPPIGMPHMDSKGRIWFHAQEQAGISDYCKKGSGNPFAEYFPMPEGVHPRHMENYDPKTGKFEVLDMCLTPGHLAFGNDKDETVYYNDTAPVPPRMGGVGWVHTRIWDETHDMQKSMGWCPAVIDYNGDGKTGAYTKPDEPIDPKLDRAVAGANGYGFAFNPADGSLWSAEGEQGQIEPGKIMRYEIGTNPPATCKTEAYEPPFDNPKRPGVEAFLTLGIAVGTDGMVWAALSGNNDLASFDRRKCKGPLNGPTATGQHCPEGWTLYPVPSPKFKGTDVPADYFYHNWLDRYDGLGLGKNVPIINSNGSDSLIAFVPETKKFVTMRVPYPLDFYTRNADFRIDDPNAGWKGRGMWTGNEEKVIWHLEGGKGNKTSIAHFQIRPDPLAK